MCSSDLLRPEEREPDFLLKEGLLEKVEDFQHNGMAIPASRLGYRWVIAPV